MSNRNLARNIILAFVFFAIGRVIVTQMGDIGVWIVLALVAAFYAAWWYFRKIR